MSVVNGEGQQCREEDMKGNLLSPLEQFGTPRSCSTTSCSISPSSSSYASARNGKVLNLRSSKFYFRAKTALGWERRRKLPGNGTVMKAGWFSSLSPLPVPKLFQKAFTIPAIEWFLFHLHLQELGAEKWRDWNWGHLRYKLLSSPPFFLNVIRAIFLLFVTRLEVKNETLDLRGRSRRSPFPRRPREECPLPSSEIWAPRKRHNEVISILPGAYNFAFKASVAWRLPFNKNSLLLESKFPLGSVGWNGKYIALSESLYETSLFSFVLLQLDLPFFSPGKLQRETAQSVGDIFDILSGLVLCDVMMPISPPFRVIPLLFVSLLKIFELSAFETSLPFFFL